MDLRSRIGLRSAARSAGVDDGTLYRWVQRYEATGHIGLADKKRGSIPEEKPVEKEMDVGRSVPLNGSEREGLIRLGEENKYIKAENEVIKRSIFHSDQGWQYQHQYFRKALKGHGVIQTMSRKGDRYDNCIVETFSGRMKNEMHYDQESEYRSSAEPSAAVDQYISYYNNDRIQEKTKWMPPAVCRQASIC